MREMNALETNAGTCVLVANAIRSTLGPCGMDKLLLYKVLSSSSSSSDGRPRFVVTNDGATLLRHLDVQQGLSSSERPLAAVTRRIQGTERLGRVDDGTVNSAEFDEVAWKLTGK